MNLYFISMIVKADIVKNSNMYSMADQIQGEICTDSFSHSMSYYLIAGIFTLFAIFVFRIAHQAHKSREKTITISTKSLFILALALSLMAGVYFAIPSLFNAVTMDHAAT